MILSTKVFRWFGNQGIQGRDEVRHAVTFGYMHAETIGLEPRQTPGPEVPPEWIDKDQWQCFLHDPKDDRWYAVPRLRGDDNVLVYVWHSEYVPVVVLNDPMDEVFL